ncbi:MAG: hypothetical protein J3Q66DRAFT_325948 [Benniella sp.]|nr:MAG: hypothetical protein J3Q66DRAFT_325948 [Benniella sp.]
MRESASVFEIPELLDIICSGLQLPDIKNCTVCCKSWYSVFGPYRFRSLRIVHSDRGRIKFLYPNSRLIRKLDISLQVLKTFGAPRCTRLQELGILSQNGTQDEETDSEVSEVSEENEDCEDDVRLLDMPAQFKIKSNKFRGAAYLIRKNQHLQALTVRAASQTSKALAWRILNAIRNHAFLVKVKVDFPNCFRLIRLLNYLPSQLQELDVKGYTPAQRNSYTNMCYAQMLFERNFVLGLRRLNLAGCGGCINGFILMQLLVKFPNLEELHLPSMECRDEATFDNAELAQVIDSHCNRLRTLSSQLRSPKCAPSKRMCALLCGSSKGFRQLSLRVRICRHHNRRSDSMGGYFTSDDDDDDFYLSSDALVLKAIPDTSTVNMIEVLRLDPAVFIESDHVIGILERCPRLREFWVRGVDEDCDGIDISDLVQSMDTPWSCQNTLEVLGLEVHNRKIGMEWGSLAGKRRKTCRVIRQLFLGLRSFPELATLDIDWQLQAEWSPIHIEPRMILSLTDMNQDDDEEDPILITKEDMEWMGLSQP